MAHRELDDYLSLPANTRPVVLEGQWLGEVSAQALAAAEPVSVFEGNKDALEELPSWLAWHTTKYPAGAAVGFLSYELARFFESLALPRDDSLPDLCFAFYPALEKIPQAIFAQEAGADSEAGEVSMNFDRESYCRVLEKIRRYLASGDIYQANLTQQFSVCLGTRSPGQIYRELSEGRAPYRAFLKSPSRTIISNSPERFFRISGRRILASPIKGTVARSADRTEDAGEMQRLRSSTKDRAENVMIVDLLRNDLGRICTFGSVESELWQVLPLPYLFHLVSHVRGILRPEIGLVDIFRALFPCGSITGAPKIRAMEILAEIERVPRGVSMGAIGVIRGTPGSEALEAEFNVAIRTLTIRENVAVFNVGGGIVYDSRPDEEYAEMMLKARPLLEALGVLGAADLYEAPTHALER